MADERGKKMTRLGQASRKLNIGHNTILDFLSAKGFEVERSPNAKLTEEQFRLLSEEFADSASEKQEALNLKIKAKTTGDFTPKEKTDAQNKKEYDEDQILIKNLGSTAIKVKDDTTPGKIPLRPTKLPGIKVVGNVDLTKKKKEAPPPEKTVSPQPPKQKKAPPEEPKKETIKAKADTLKGLKVVDKITIEKPPQKSHQKPASKEKPVASSDTSDKEAKKKRPRRRIYKQNINRGKTKKPFARDVRKEAINEQEVQKQVRATLAKLSGSQKKTTASARHRKEKKKALLQIEEGQSPQEQGQLKTLKVTEYISANDLAVLMNTSVNEIISTCLNMGMFVSINQRLDAEAITVIADEFGYNAEFTTATEDEVFEQTEENEENLLSRAPIVTIMGHVDHGKTSLLDYIRETRITDQEAGGITQHIGAYNVTTKSGQKVTFLDTPGHEAFMAMRARGAKLTDLAIIVVAADDDVMPQTKEAINHAQVAGIPLVVAINKIDKPGADPEKIKKSLSEINILVEDWGGKYQCQDISAKTGQGISDLLEKVLLEAELLDLKADPDKPGMGSVVEASLDKGRGYIATLMVQAGQLKVGDVVLAGSNFGRIKALVEDTGKRIKSAGPSTPVQVLGLNGAPQAGEKFYVVKTDKEAREKAVKRSQILREQSVRTRKHITLDEIGRRLAVGSFKELKIIIKGDVDGSIEALSDSLLKLSTPNIQVAIIHKAVGQISESDVLLASASNALIIGFQVRPSGAARKLAESEKIEIRLYAIIYDAINDVQKAMEGMLEKKKEEVVVGTAEVRELFKISKVGTVAGSMVTEGYIKNNNPIRLVRDGIVVYSGNLNTLKRFKENATEVKSGFDCGIGIKDFNDLKVGDTIESYEIREVENDPAAK